MPQCTFCQRPVDRNAERCPHCAAWLRLNEDGARPDDVANSVDEAAELEIRSLLRQNRKIEAIKIYRERTGAGLAEAKSAVERLERSGTLSADELAADDVDPQLLELLMAGEKIKAIKLYREQTNLGLKESKDAVEAIAARHGIAPQRIGCTGVVAVVVAAGAMALIGWLGS